MKHMDFTIDFETCSLSANAAVMQVAIVPWLRGNYTDPFLGPVLDPASEQVRAGSKQELEPYVGYVDLRTCVVDGFDFDPSTVKWWSERSEAAKKAVTADLPGPVSDVLITVLDYIRDVRKRYEVDSMCLWCQGPDVDIAILRNLCLKYDVNLEDIIPHTSFRDSRTVILEAAHARYRKEIREANRALRGGDRIATSMMVCGEMVPCNPDKYLECPSEAYKLFDPLPDRYAGGSEAHDALYDALRTSWNTWQALKWMNI